MVASESTPLLKKPEKKGKGSSHVHFHHNRVPYFSRWQSLAGVCMYVSLAGTTYAFGVYSQLLKTNLGFSQGGLDLVASIGNTGLYLSLIAGIALERFGLKFVVFGGGFLIFVGFVYIYLAIKEFVPADIASISVFYFLSQFGVCCHVSSAVTYCVRLMPREARGKSVGLGKGYFALSSAVLGDFAASYFEDNSAEFLLFIAIVIPIVGMIGSSVANLLPEFMINSFDYEHANGISSSLLPFYAHWGTLFVILFAVGFIQYRYTVPDAVSYTIATLLAFTILSIQILPDYYGQRTIMIDEVGEPHHLQNESYQDSNTKSTSSATEVYIANAPETDNKVKATHVKDKDSDKQQQPLLQHSDDDAIPVSESLRNQIESGDVKGKTTTDNNTNHNSSEVSKDSMNDSYDHSEDTKGSYESFTQPDATNVMEQGCFYGQSVPLSFSITTWRFWVLYFIFMTVTGAGLMVIYNINAIAEAVSVTPSSFFIALISLANGFGRVFAGFSSDRFVHRISKLQIMALIAFAMSVTAAFFAIGSPILLYPCSVFVGFLFGCIVSLIAVNVADIFGAKYVATNFGAIDSAPIFGSYIYATGIVALFYVTNTNLDDDYDGSSATCVGKDCFRIPFIIISVCNFLAAIMCLVMHQYTPIETVAVTNIRRDRCDSRYSIDENIDTNIL